MGTEREAKLRPPPKDICNSRLGKTKDNAAWGPAVKQESSIQASIEWDSKVGLSEDMAKVQVGNSKEGQAWEPVFGIDQESLFPKEDQEGIDFGYGNDTRDPNVCESDVDDISVGSHSSHHSSHQRTGGRLRRRHRKIVPHNHDDYASDTEVNMLTPSYRTPSTRQNHHQQQQRRRGSVGTITTLMNESVYQNTTMKQRRSSLNMSTLITADGSNHSERRRGRTSDVDLLGSNHSERSQGRSRSNHSERSRSRSRHTKAFPNEDNSVHKNRIKCDDGDIRSKGTAKTSEGASFRKKLRSAADEKKNEKEVANEKKNGKKESHRSQSKSRGRSKSRDRGTRKSRERSSSMPLYDDSVDEDEAFVRSAADEKNEKKVASEKKNGKKDSHRRKLRGRSKSRDRGRSKSRERSSSMPLYDDSPDEDEAFIVVKKVKDKKKKGRSKSLSRKQSGGCSDHDDHSSSVGDSTNGETSLPTVSASNNDELSRSLKTKGLKIRKSKALDQKIRGAEMGDAVDRIRIRFVQQRKKENERKGVDHQAQE